MSADNLKNTLYEEVIKAAGGSVDDLPDNLESTYLKRIAEAVANGGGGGGGVEHIAHSYAYETEVGGDTYISPSYNLTYANMDDGLYMFVFHSGEYGYRDTSYHYVSFAQLAPSQWPAYSPMDVYGTKIGDYDIRIRDYYYEYDMDRFEHIGMVLTIELNGELQDGIDGKYTELTVYKLA